MKLWKAPTTFLCGNVSKTQMWDVGDTYLPFN